MTVQTALAYAEKQLGVHSIYDETQELRRFLDHNYEVRSGLESESRSLATQMERRRMQIITERMTSVEESIASHERAVKVALAADSAYQELVDRSNEVMAHRDAVSATISGAENNMKAHTARMNLLGGFFEFCASVKQDEVLSAMEKLQNPF